ncbi:hypothetical protein ACE04B_03175 [Rhizobium phaseoli]
MAGSGQATPASMALAGNASPPIGHYEFCKASPKECAYAGGDAGFCEAVRQAANRAGGELLFDLPAAGLVADCRRIAVLRIPDGGSEMRVVLALLDYAGTEIRMQAPDEDTAHLVRFADAFVALLERI